MIPPPLYTNFKGRKCLTDVGTEGRAQNHLNVFVRKRTPTARTRRGNRYTVFARKRTPTADVRDTVQ